jgi:hypothetical protein
VLAVLLEDEREAGAARQLAGRLCGVSRHFQRLARRFLACRLRPLRCPAAACGCGGATAVCRRCLAGATCAACEECAARVVDCRVCGTKKMACCTPLAPVRARCSRCSQTACADCISACDCDLLQGAVSFEPERCHPCACKTAVMCKECCQTDQCHHCGIRVCVPAMHALATEEVKLLDRCDDCGAIVCLRCRRLNTASGAAACNACLYFKEWEEAQHGEAQYQAFLARM